MTLWPSFPTGHQGAPSARTTPGRRGESLWTSMVTGQSHTRNAILVHEPLEILPWASNWRKKLKQTKLVICHLFLYLLIQIIKGNDIWYPEGRNARESWRNFSMELLLLWTLDHLRRHAVWLRPPRPKLRWRGSKCQGLQVRAEVRDLGQWQFTYTSRMHMFYRYIKASLSYLREMRINMGYIPQASEKWEVKCLARYHTQPGQILLV